MLVVENSPTIISVADSLLRTKGYDVTCLNDGNKALEFARTEKPDLVLTAIGINGIDGLQLCKNITSETLTGGIPVVLLVGDKDDVYQDKFDIVGARGRIHKPFSPKELVSIVDKFTGGVKQHPAKLVDQNDQTGPRLNPKGLPEEIGTATKNVAREKVEEQNRKHETVYNLEWQDLKDDPDFQPEREGAGETDDSGLVLDDDQYGLTKLNDEAVPMAPGAEDEDYDWFIGEMKKEIAGEDEKKEAPPQAPPPVEAEQQEEQDLSYDSIGSPRTGSKDDAKYRQFLEQFKKDTSVMTEEKPSIGSATGLDVNWLVDRIADRLAQKIVEKLDKNELRQIINSFLNDTK